jgi:glucose-6-phosphate isomerase
MKKNLIIKNNFFSKKKTKKIDLFKISSSIDRIKKNLNKKNVYNLFSKRFKLNFNESELRKFKKLKSVVVIGMGGSVLGSKAIHSLMEHKIKRNFIFMDNIDQSFLKRINLEDKKKLLFIIISKSGNTLETLVNVNLLASFNLNKKNTIIITENNANALNKFAKKKNILTIEHRDYIGGRYSVLSEVGMVPAYFMDLNTKKFRKNILSHFNKSKKKTLVDSIYQMSKYYLSKDISSIIFFNYSSKLNNLAFWCQQLLAESLGKKNKGILPVLSKAPKDHHSLLQLYLDGPRDKIFYVFSEKKKNDKKIRNYFNDTFNYISNKNIHEIIESQKNAFLESLKKKKIPYKEIIINKLNEETLGEFFSYFILETASIGKSISINPFNQPAVEEVKILTKKNLT